MKLHRLLTVLFIAAIVIHVFQVGISLPRALHYEEAKPLPSAPVETAAPVEPSAPVESSVPETAPAESLATFSGAVLKDGTYEGTAEGYRGDVTVSVTVLGGAVTEISVTGQNETPQYYARAEGIIESILSSQSLEVDGVTGATFTSKAIQNAVYNALQEAVDSGEMKITDIVINNSHSAQKSHK